MATLFSIILDAKYPVYGTSKGWAPRKRGPAARKRQALKKAHRQTAPGMPLKAWLRSPVGALAAGGGASAQAVGT